MTVDNQFILRKLQSLENATIVFSTVTKHPFLVCDEETFDDELLLFADVQEMQEFVKTYVAKGYVLHGVTVPKDKLARFLSECFTLGVNQLIYQENGTRFSVSLDKIVIRPDYSKLPQEKRPLLNPQLQLSVLYFLQELSRRIPEEQKELIFERLLVKPGLSCYWQIQHTPEMPIDEQMELDLKYIRERSMTTDLKLILKTFGIIIHGRNY